MKKFLYILIALVFTTSNAQSISLSESISNPAANAFLSLKQTDTHTQQFAGVYWLPDFLGDNTGRTNSGGKANPCDGLTNYSAPYGCQKTYANCSSKCQTPNVDNCRNRTTISIPSNASCSKYFSDCSSKCETWGCDSGYTKSGSVCIDACQYSMTVGSCISTCQEVGSKSCTTKGGNTYYDGCGKSMCKAGQSCSGGRCAVNCDYTITKEYCTSQCQDVSTSSCARDGTTYYFGCGNSTCGSEQRCVSGTCVNNCTYDQTATTCNDQCKDVGTATCTRGGTTYYESCGQTRGSKDCTGVAACKVVTQVAVSTCKNCSGQTLATCREKTCAEQDFKLLKDFIKPLPTCKSCAREYYYNGTLVISATHTQPLTMLAMLNKFKEMFEIKNANAEAMPMVCPIYQILVNGKCINKLNCQAGQILVNGVCQDMTAQACLAGQTLVNGKCEGGLDVDAKCMVGQIIIDGECVDDIAQPQIVRYDFIVSSTCPSDNSYLKGEWVERTPTCEDLGFKLLNDFVKPVPTCENCAGEYYYNGTLITKSGLTASIINEGLMNSKILKTDKSSIFSKIAELFTIKNANAVIKIGNDVDTIGGDSMMGSEPTPSCAIGYIMQGGRCVVDPNYKPLTPDCPGGLITVDGRCVGIVTETPECPAGQNLVNGKCFGMVKTIRYEFIASSICPSDSSYLKGQWVQVSEIGQ